MSGTPYLISGNSAASGGSTELILSVTADVGNTDVVYVGVLVSESGVTPSVTDTQENDYIQILDDTTETAAQLYVFQATGVNPLTSGVDNIAITYSANTSAQAAVAVGDNNVSTSDVAIIAHGSGTAVSTGTSATLSQTEEHAILFVCNAHAGGDPSFASPWSAEVLAQQGAGTTAILSAAYQDVTANTALTGTATITSAAWTAALITDEVNFPTITTIPSDGVENEAYSQTLVATGGIEPYTYALASGSFPGGISISDGVISGTPTESGTFAFTLQVEDSESVHGYTDTLTITILPSGASGVATLHMPGQLLTAADQDCEDTAGSWVADTNAESIDTTSEISLTGDYSLMWVATDDGETSIHTGYYNVTAGNSYVVSGYILPCGQRDTQIGIEWYESNDTLIEQDLGTDNPSSSIAWQPLAFAGTAPSGATKCRVVYLVQEANAGDVTHIDATYFAQSGCQVLIDWENPTFAAGSQAGQDFMDVTPWVRMDQGINIQRGRQDAVSEIMQGSATFQLQNDTGLFTRYVANTLIGAIGGDQTLQRRVQINLTDENGAWWTRYDGPIAEIDYTFDNTGNTNLAQVTVTDILAELSRQDALECWTKELVLSDGPALHWTLDDAGNSGGFGVAAESSGNNGPPMRLINTDTSGDATIGWQDTSSGVETLADAVTPGEDDGSEYWTAGNVTPNSPIRGLDSGNVGPYTTPLPSVLLTPKLTTQSGQNYYLGNKGYQFQVALPSLIEPTAVGSDYSIEIWFTEAPSSAAGGGGTPSSGGIAGNDTSNYGPFTLFSLANSRSGLTMVLTVAPATNHLTFQVWLYSQPPGFVGANFSGSAPPTNIGEVATELSGDSIAVPHHAVVTIEGDPTSPTVVAYLDGALFSDEDTSTTLPAGTVFDTLTCGGAYGGTGCYWGNLQLLSIYDYLMSGTQVINHASMGQYGMWEQATDDCIAQLATFANIPSFWNNIEGASNGLTLTEYQDITGSNALTNMQLYEDTEMGLLFVDAEGRLNFHTRDWRMGYGAPDLYLPPDTFDASMGYETIDQFQINEQAVSTQTYQTGAAYVNSDSQDKYGPYATDGIGSPIQLPLITWSRGYSQLGLASYYYWSDPYLEDYCAWAANSKAEPWLVPGQLTIDILTLSKESTGVGISDLYALEIDSLIAPSGTLPASFPNVNLSTEWFIEGVNEVYSTSQREIQFYCSPGEPQRAWKPGDATYGVLGTTTRIGVSAPDTNAPVADGKDVSHDAGGPYWAPDFSGYFYGDVGAYLDIDAMGATDIDGALVLWEEYTETTPQVLRYYLGASDFTYDTNMQEMVAAGIKINLTLRPSYTSLNTTDLNNMVALLENMLADGADVEVALWHEPYWSGLTSAEFIDMFQYYAPSILALGVPTVFCTSASSVVNDSENSYYPGDEYVTKVACDVYIGATSTLGTGDTNDPAYCADNASPPKPFGIWEFGTPQNFLVQSNNQGFEQDSYGNWTNGTNCSISESTAQAHSGTYSLAVKSTAAGDMEANSMIAADITTLGMPCTPGDTVTCSAWFRAATSSRSVKVGAQWYESSGTQIDVTYGSTVADSTTGWTEATASLVAPGTSAYCRLQVYVVGTGAADEIHYVDDVVLDGPGRVTRDTDYIESLQTYMSGRASSGLQNADVLWFNSTGPGGFSATITSADDSRIAPYQTLYSALAAGPLLNNPSQNGHDFIGAVDIRGLTYNLGLKLNPPMCVVGATGKTQSQGSGSNSTPQIYWDNIYVDTVGGMGLVPGWPNWYVCTVAGFYDIDGCLVWNGVTGAAEAAQAFIIVAMGAAQAVAADTATPTSVDQYVCPIGEQAFINAHSTQVVNCPTTRLYLGVGDMVTIGAEQASGSSISTSTTWGGSKMSLLFRGYAQYDDRQLINSSITGGSTSSGNGGGSGGTPTKTTYTKTYKNKATYSYYGAANSYSRKNTNGSCYQGTYSGGTDVTGSETSLILMPYSTIQSDISGATIKSIKLTCTNEHTWYNSGGDIMLGWSKRGNGPSTCKMTSGTDYPNVYRASFSEGHGKTLSLPVSTFGGPLAHLGCFLLGNQSTTNLDYYGYWKGGANSWTLTIVYEK